MTVHKCSQHGCKDEATHVVTLDVMSKHGPWIKRRWFCKPHAEEAKVKNDDGFYMRDLRQTRDVLLRRNVDEGP